MTKSEFQSYQEKYATTIEAIRDEAHALHQSVNQTYGDNLPYGFHLDMVAEGVRLYGYLVCASEADVVPLFFGAYFHDSIEDARQSYHDITKRAQKFMNDDQALMAAEIVFALTNDKGRTRAERAGERYFQGIRETAYAPFVKLCDRLANVIQSCQSDDSHNLRMKEIYSKEMPHFLDGIALQSDDPRRQVPQVVIDEMMGLLQKG